MILLGVLTLMGIFSLNFLVQAFAEVTPEGYVIRQDLTWELFYKMMVAAFIVGTIVNAIIIYVIWRYRESHKKNRIVEPPAEGTSE